MKKPPFRVGILGAGLGSRLQSSTGAKPLAKVGAESLLGLLVERFRSRGLTEILCALREEQFTPELRAQLPEYPGLRYLFANTESSLHTLGELIRVGTATGPTLFTMADTVMLPEDFHRFLRFCETLSAHENAVLLTTYVDDEKPLYAEVNAEGFVLDFGAKPTGQVTSGMYFLQPRAQELALRELSQGTHKMRNFLSKLASEGFPIKSFVVAKTIDVDHPSDLEKAAFFLHSGQGKSS